MPIGVLAATRSEPLAVDVPDEGHDRGLVDLAPDSPLALAIDVLRAQTAVGHRG